MTNDASFANLNWRLYCPWSVYLQLSIRIRILRTYVANLTVPNVDIPVFFLVLALKRIIAHFQFQTKLQSFRVT